jgi:hypothetical protein
VKSKYKGIGGLLHSICGFHPNIMSGSRETPSLINGIASRFYYFGVSKFLFSSGINSLISSKATLSQDNSRLGCSTFSYLNLLN